MTIKIFDMNDCDWYAGETADDAIRGMAENLGFATTPEGIAEMRQDFTVADIRELTEQELDELMYVDEDENEQSTKVKRSFRDQLALMIANGDHFPCFFASTEG